MKQQPDFLFLAECAAQALQQVLRDLCRAYTNFFEGRAKFPKPKSRKRTPTLFAFHSGFISKGNAFLSPR
ncbi:MAG TPA: hypothetical protein VKU00_21685 [Chthonomonadaceae bacterium]|nr:hypothetical protein [Chthonomonadaceae bacterium]